MAAGGTCAHLSPLQIWQNKMNTDPSVAKNAPASQKNLLWQAGSVALFFMAAYWLVRFEAVALVADTVAYLAGAKSLANGDGYRMAWHIGLPKIGFYPPGQSLWLALFWPSGVSYVEALPRLLASMVVMGGLVNGLVYALARRADLPNRAALGLVGVWGFSPLWVQWLFWLMSDPGFLAILLGMMVWAIRGRTSPGNWGWLGLGLGTAAALIFRTAGIGIYAGMVVVGLVVSRRNWKAPLCLLLPGLVVLVGWRAWNVGMTGYGDTYTQTIQDTGGFLGIIHAKADEALSWLSGRFFFEAVFPLLSRAGIVVERAAGKAGATLVNTAMAACFFCMLWFAWKGIRGRWTAGLRAIVVVLAVYSAIVYVAPNPGWFVHRYLYPVWLLILIYATHGLGDSLRNRNRPSGRYFAWAAVVVALGINVAGTLRTRNFWRHPDELAELGVIADHLAKEPGSTPLVEAEVDDVPVMYLGDRLGNSIVANYHFPPAFPILARAADQGWRRPQFLVTSATAFETNYPGLFTLELGADHKRWRLFRIDADADAAWRRQKGLPPAP